MKKVGQFFYLPKHIPKWKKESENIIKHTMWLSNEEYIIYTNLNTEY